jgi:hypothetical protein
MRILVYIVYEFHRRTVCGYGRKIVVYGVIVVLLQLGFDWRFTFHYREYRVFRGYGGGRSLVADCCPSGFAKTFFRLTRRFVLADMCIVRQL